MKASERMGNESVICCPKCRMPGTLYAKRSLSAIIGSKHIAHVLHLSSRADSRRSCLLTRSDMERIERNAGAKAIRRD